MKYFAFTAMTAAALLMGTPAAFAAMALKDSTPAQGAHVHKVSTITLHFTTALNPAKSGARLIGPSGKGIAVATSVSRTAITLLPFQLAPGSWHVDWHVAGQDNSKAKGRLTFTVAP